MSEINNETLKSKIEDYYVPKDIALAKGAYLDAYDTRNWNFLLSLPFGIASMIWPKSIKTFGGKPGAFFIGSLLSFSVLDYFNDLRFN